MVADDYYEYVTAASNDIIDYVLNAINLKVEGKSMANDSNMAKQQLECFGCSLGMPGLCYPKAQ